MDNQVQNPQDDQQIQPQIISVDQVGLPQKEAEPIARKEPFVKASEEELRLHSEVSEAGVETVSEKPELREEHFKIGIDHAKEFAPVKTEPSDKISFPMTAQKANQIIKSKKNFKSSVLWLAISILRQIKIINKAKKHD